MSYNNICANLVHLVFIALILETCFTLLEAKYHVILVSKEQHTGFNQMKSPITSGGTTVVDSDYIKEFDIESNIKTVGELEKPEHVPAGFKLSFYLQRTGRIVSATPLEKVLINLSGAQQILAEVLSADDFKKEHGDYQKL
ncbi:hypothetical protein DdX_21360 [Ditylenchus destructor]|uniref:Uncharacterized protein n=1 Tax=Ditylenchus destructor TaxID=166010 RepID=A0AAD4MFX0_9BILA|nr:hypothetical protein DdX_21360 [Ditylenchus destructor]